MRPLKDINEEQAAKRLEHAKKVAEKDATTDPNIRKKLGKEIEDIEEELEILRKVAMRAAETTTGGRRRRSRRHTKKNRKSRRHRK